MKRFCFATLLVLFVINVAAGTITVVPGSNTLSDAIAQSKPGDILVLAEGEYHELSNIEIPHAIAIESYGDVRPIIVMSGRLEVKENITLKRLVLKSNGAGEAMRLLAGAKPYDVVIGKCDFLQFSSRTIRAYATDQSAPYIASLAVDECLFRPSGGRCIEASTTDKQLAKLSITRSTFDGGKNDVGRFVYLKSEGTIMQSMLIDGCTFYNANDTRAIYLADIDGAKVSNSIFMNPVYDADNKSFCVYGSQTLLTHCLSYNADMYIRSGAQSNKVSTQNPYFVDAENGNFQLYKNSPAATMSADGKPIGDPRWGVSEKEADRSSEPYLPYKMPYSMSPTTTSFKVLWQMAEESLPTMATVWYGKDKDNLTDSVVSSEGWNVDGEGYMHVIDITGLQPNTRYYFQVGDASRRCEVICSSVTAPEAGTAYRIFTLSDIHGNSCNNWSNMQDFICALEPDIAIFNGDHVSDNGADRNWNSYFFTPGQPFLACTPIMSSAGNHETGVPSNYRWSSCYDYFWQFSHGNSEDSIIDPRGEAYFSFPYGNAEIVVININGDKSSPDFLPGSQQYQWLDETLGASTAPWIFIFGHVGIYTSGYHGRWSANPKRLAPLLEKHAAEGKRIIYFCGDDHSFEHLFKDGVHYVRPGCGRNANYAQQTDLVDARYSIYYRQVSCFSTIDMSAGADTVLLTAYDSVGNLFYTYDFLLANKVENPSVSITSESRKYWHNNYLLISYQDETYDVLGNLVKNIFN